MTIVTPGFAAIVSFRKPYTFVMSDSSWSVSNGATGFMPCVGYVQTSSQDPLTTIGANRVQATEAGTLKNARLLVNTAGGGTAGKVWTITLLKNGSATNIAFSLACDAALDVTATDSDTVSVAAGDKLEWQIAHDAATAQNLPRLTITMDLEAPTS